jgi:hypothetical protein
MNSEEINRTMEFILKSQARAETRAEAFDRRLDALRKIVQQGMRVLARTEASLARTEASLAKTESSLAKTESSLSHLNAAMVELAVAQKRTDTALAELAKSVKAFFDRRLSSNGNA